MRLTEEQPPCDGVEDMGCDMCLSWLLWGRPSR